MCLNKVFRNVWRNKYLLFMYFSNDFWNTQHNLHTPCGIWTRVWKILSLLRDHFANGAVLKTVLHRESSGNWTHDIPVMSGAFYHWTTDSIKFRERDLNSQPLGPKPSNLPLIYPGVLRAQGIAPWTIGLKGHRDCCCATRA